MMHSTFDPVFVIENKLVRTSLQNLLKCNGNAMEKQKIKVLLIEDDNIDQMAFERFVRDEELPYDYVIAGSVLEGRRTLRAEGFDVVVMDYLLGDGTGFDLFKEVHGDIPIIVTTGTGGEEIAIQAMKSGALDYLIKDPEGYYLKTLPITIERAIEIKNQGRELREYHDQLKRMVEERTRELKDKNKQLKTEVQERRRAEEALREAHDDLEKRVEKRTVELASANKQLQAEMHERKRMEKALVQREKLKTLGAISAEVAHEIRNPLMSIGGFALRLKKRFPDIYAADIILKETRRLEGLLNRIRDYLQPVEIQPRECSVNAIIADCVNLMAPQLNRKPVTCVSELSESMSMVSADPDILTQVFINLIKNAVDSMNEGQTLVIKTFENEQYVNIVFENPVSGVKVKDPELLFLPFDEGGQSIGLPLCYRLLKEMGGLLSFNQEQNCIVFTVCLEKCEWAE